MELDGQQTTYRHNQDAHGMQGENVEEDDPEQEFFVGFKDDYPMWSVESSSPQKAIQEIARLNGLDESQLRANPE